MRLLRPQPDTMYLSRDLWLPKSQFREEQVHRVFTFPHPRKESEVIRAFRSTPTHWLVPRNTYDPEWLRQRGTLVDLRHRDFPRVDLKSSVVLDYREPDKSYQREGHLALLGAHDGILCLRCGGGKTAVALHSAAALKTPVLVVVDDVGLAQQWKGSIKAFLGVDNPGQVYDSKFDWEHPITIASVQTLARRAAERGLPFEMLQHFGVLLLDEAHVMAAPFFSAAIPPFYGRRWGLSATPKREDQFDPLLSYLMGPVVYTYLEHVLKPTVVFRLLNTTLPNTNEVREATLDRSGELHLGMLYSYLATRQDRIAKIVADVNEAVGNGRNVLVLSHSRELCERLGDIFPGGAATHGGVKGKDHERIVREANPLVAIMKRGKQALDKPELDTIFVCEPFAKAGITQQVLGRMLRPVAGKQAPTLVLYEDHRIRRLNGMCKRLRLQLNRWPANQGGAIPYKIMKEV